MILRRGVIRIPHFAHRPGEACGVDYEPESQYHLKAKLAAKQLFRFSRVELEPLLGSSNYMARPDLVIDERYAVEVQVSPISLEGFFRKTLFYSRRGLRAIWIFGEGKYRRPEWLRGDEGLPCYSLQAVERELAWIFGQVQYVEPKMTFVGVSYKGIWDRKRLCWQRSVVPLRGAPWDPEWVEIEKETVLIPYADYLASLVEPRDPDEDLWTHTGDFHSRAHAGLLGRKIRLARLRTENEGACTVKGLRKRIVIREYEEPPSPSLAVSVNDPKAEPLISLTEEQREALRRLDLSDFF